MRNCKNILSTALISDILDELGYKEQMLPIQIKPNFLAAKIFGRARIMTLKHLSKKENYKDVYKGLYFLETLKKGEILIVANGFSEHAFFGELMATLARNKKIEGTIIDGCTRDTVPTVKMRYPVFARDNIAKDIKKRGIVDKTDTPSTRIGGVTIKKGDLLFGDNDGVIIIPKNLEEKVILKALKVAKIEEKIKKGIKSGLSVKDLLRKFGEF